MVILDDDAPAVPSISVAPVFVTEGNYSRNVSFRLRLSAPAPSEVQVRVATAAGSATGTDFTAVNKTVVIPKDAEETLVAVEITNDFEREPVETFSLLVSDAVGATIATPVAVATIFDNDDPEQDPNAITAGVSGASIVEGNAGHAPVRFTVQLSRASSSPVTVAYATADGGAVAPADYLAVSGTLVFAPGETSKTVDVLVAGDREFEAGEAFTLVLGDAAGARTATRTAAARIVDDDEEQPSHRRSARH